MYLVFLTCFLCGPTLKLHVMGGGGGGGRGGGQQASCLVTKSAGISTGSAIVCAIPPLLPSEKANMCVCVCVCVGGGGGGGGG